MRPFAIVPGASRLFDGPATPDRVAALAAHRTGIISHRSRRLTDPFQTPNPSVANVPWDPPPTARCHWAVS